MYIIYDIWHVLLIRLLEFLISKLVEFKQGEIIVISKIPQVMSLPMNCSCQNQDWKCVGLTKKSAHIYGSKTQEICDMCQLSIMFDLTRPPQWDWWPKVKE